MTEYTVITDAAGLAGAVATLAGRNRAGRGRRRARVRVPLLAARVPRAGVPPRRGGVPVRPARGRRLRRRCRPRSADEEWVLHAASQDLPSLREIGLEPATMFDTELAARLLGHARVGLGAVVEDTLGITLAKAHSASDWSTRPAPAGVARVRRARCRAPRRRPRRAGRPSSPSRARPSSPPRSSGRCSSACPKPRARGAVAPAERPAHGARAQGARGRARAVDGARGIRAGAGRRAGPARARPGARRRAHRGPEDQAGAGAAQGVHRTGEPQPAGPLVGGVRGGPGCDRSAARAGAPAETPFRPPGRGPIAIPMPTRG